MKRSTNFLLLFSTVFIFFSFSQTAFGQSCGGGKSIFHIFDETGKNEIKEFNVSFQIVSEDQAWRGNDFSQLGWKRQMFDEKTAKKYINTREREGFERAYEISFAEFSRLSENREQIIKTSPDSVVATTEKDRCGNLLQQSVKLTEEPFNICTTEGCSFMVVAEIKAEGYENGYFVSDFTCSCTKHYELRLKKTGETRIISKH